MPISFKNASMPLIPAAAKKEFPEPLPLKKLIGPSFIILALGLGSGEVILWPYLVSNYGLGIAWGAILGITFQYFINMEIERYALVKGESVFVGINKVFPRAAYWFIFSTFVGFGLPGIVAASAKVFSQIIGVMEFKWVAMAMLVFIGFVLSSGKTVYGPMERLTKTVILIGVPFIFLLAFALSGARDWSALYHGVVGAGSNYNFLPAGIALATFFAAFAYSGAGGNLNLTQSIYVKEKGYGMGKYSQKIAGLFSRGKTEQKIKLRGEIFDINPESVSRFRIWWRRINLEHFLVFWLVGSLSMLLLMLLAYSTAYGLQNNAEGINFVINEGAVIGRRLYPILGTFFLLAVAIMLFQTQLGIMDSTSRIMAENLAIKKIGANSAGSINLSKIYYYFVWAQVVFGGVLFLLDIHEPRSLIVLGAVINAFAMFIHTALVSWTNYKILPKEFHPGWFRRLALLGIFLFFGFFSFLVLWDKLS